MKNLSRIVCVLFSAACLRASEDSFLIKLRGAIMAPDGSVKLNETDLVTTNGNLFVYRIDTTNHIFRIVETDSTGTNMIRENCHSDDGSVNSAGKVTFDLHDTFDYGKDVPLGFTSNVGGIVPFRGRMMAVGKITPAAGTPKKIRLTVSGVWNSASNSVFKGTITGTRLP